MGLEGNFAASRIKETGLVEAIASASTPTSSGIGQGAPAAPFSLPVFDGSAIAGLGGGEELELDEWLEDQIEASEPPEDWTGSVDVEPEDTENEYEAEPGASGAWGDPLQSLDRGEVGGYSELEMSDLQDEADRY